LNSTVHLMPVTFCVFSVHRDAKIIGPSRSHEREEESSAVLFARSIVRTRKEGRIRAHHNERWRGPMLEGCYRDSLVARLQQPPQDLSSLRLWRWPSSPLRVRRGRTRSLSPPGTSMRAQPMVREFPRLSRHEMVRGTSTPTTFLLCSTIQPPYWRPTSTPWEPTPVALPSPCGHPQPTTATTFSLSSTPPACSTSCSPSAHWVPRGATTCLRS
jgi:hypothetical protein